MITLHSQRLWCLTLFCDLLQEHNGNPKPEHEWPSEDYWIWRSWLGSGRFAKLEDELEPGASKLEDELETRTSESEDELEPGASDIRKQAGAWDK